jgi:hypothetical protein
MTSWVQLRELNHRHSNAVESADNITIDVNDEDDCENLLRKMAKRHGLRPSDCELVVKTGRKSRTYRTT